MRKPEQSLVWIDLEMTGLDTGHDHILEIATIVTDSELNEVAEGPVFAIHTEEAVLLAMDEWNTRHHRNSGLWQRCRESTVDMREAETRTLAFLGRHLSAGQSPMCGNSICQDRRFLAREMPELEAFFHYRNLDVSTLKELALRWAPDVLAGYQKENRHEALADIRESIAELRYYRQFLGHFAERSG